MNTTAQVFAAACGLTPEAASWAYGPRHAHYRDRTQVLTATSPLAPSPTPGWLEVLVRHPNCWWLIPISRKSGRTYEAASENANGDVLCADCANPTHAVARALIAADPALRAACEACEDWAQYKETRHD